MSPLTCILLLLVVAISSQPKVLCSSSLSWEALSVLATAGCAREPCQQGTCNSQGRLLPLPAAAAQRCDSRAGTWEVTQRQRKASSGLWGSEERGEGLLVVSLKWEPQRLRSPPQQWLVQTGCLAWRLRLLRSQLPAQILSGLSSCLGEQGGAEGEQRAWGYPSASPDEEDNRVAFYQHQFLA